MKTSHVTQRWRLAFALLAVVLGAYLILAQKPWTVAHDAGSHLHVRHYAAMFSWWAAAINLFLAGGLFVLSPWWAGVRDEPVRQIRTSAPKWFWPLVLGAMALTLFYSIPRMNDGFWDDEDLNVRTSLYGRFKQHDGEVQFVKFDWLESVYGYKKGPNSHTLFTIFSRVCEEGWNAIHPPKGYPLVEWPFRIPALVCGTLVVGAIAWLLCDLGLPVAGVIAAFLLAIHPWNIRYASEARGYSMLMLFTTLLFIFWNRALISGSWKWWGLYGLAEFALIYCYPGSIVILVVVNTLAILGMSGLFGSPRASRAQVGRWFCVNTLAAMMVIQLMLPLFPQGKAYFDYVASQGFVSGWLWARNTLCFFFGGLPWSKSSDPWAGYPAWITPFLENPILFWVVVSLAIGLVLLGAIRLLTSGRASIGLLLVTFFCPLLTFGIASFQKYLLYECYLIYSLPGLMACAAVGIAMVGIGVQRLPGGKIMGPLAIILIVLGYFGYTEGGREWIVHHSLQEVRESVVYCRGTLDPWGSDRRDVLTASFCIPPYLYDGRMDRLDSAGDFIAELHRADQEGKSLMVNIGMPWAAHEYNPQMWKIFSNHDLFDAPVRFPGFEPSLDRLVAIYKPGSAAHFDFSHFHAGKR